MPTGPERDGRSAAAMSLARCGQAYVRTIGGLGTLAVRKDSTPQTAMGTGQDAPAAMDAVDSTMAVATAHESTRRTAREKDESSNMYEPIRAGSSSGQVLPAL